eukprot:TRINITY_DN3436_c0_g1_i2.p1 TRINITY_DN3436_c0_g1~~TRINITY_DN3436_c0_g1_i2.p1  ORF type:complete len:155 (+),score=41.07 TRINITY_DN3436_c0_g1_i2:60-467(+)
MLVAAVLALAATAAAHSTAYPHIELARSKGLLDPSVPPAVLSYHVHVTYTVFNNASIEAAMKLREEARYAFRDYLAPDCPGRYDYGVLCLIEDHDFRTTLIGGPFVSGEWSIFGAPSYRPTLLLDTSLFPLHAIT